MDVIEKIHQIVDTNFDKEMDSWYYGPCDEVRALTEEFSDKNWRELIESTKLDKPDMWRVMLSHSFLDAELSIGLSENLVTFLAAKCEDLDEAYLIVQYMDGFDWEQIPKWLLRLFDVKLNQMAANCRNEYKSYIIDIGRAVNEATI